MKTNLKKIIIPALSLIIIAAGIFALLKLNNQNKDLKQQNTEDTTKIQELESQLNQIQSSSSADETPSSNYLSITELGIKLSLSSDTKDAYYGKNDSSDGSLRVVISTRSLAELEPECSASKSGLMQISSSTSSEYQTAQQNGDGRYKKVGNKYIYIENALGNCTKMNEQGLPVNPNNLILEQKLSESLHSSTILPL